MYFENCNFRKYNFKKLLVVEFKINMEGVILRVDVVIRKFWFRELFSLKCC